MGRYTGKKGLAWEAVKRWSRRIWSDCYTCGAPNLTSYNAQAGHCWPVAIVGSNNTLSWEPRQIRLQCGRCNGPGQGEQAIFEKKLEVELGKKVFAELKARRYKTDPIKDWVAVRVFFDSLSPDSPFAITPEPNVSQKRLSRV
jgi:hypothetical protein